MKDINKKLTLDDLIARKTQGETDKLAYKSVFVPSLGGELTFKKLPLRQMMQLVDGVSTNDSLTDQFEVNKELIYKACPILQSAELQAAYNCAEPYDIVPAVFCDNISEIGDVADKILEFYGLGDSLQKMGEQIKN